MSQAAGSAQKHGSRLAQLIAPRQRSVRRLIILTIVFAAWVVALLVLYFKVVAPERRSRPDPDRITLISQLTSPAAARNVLHHSA